ncbi:CAAX protease self-immunity [Nitrosomonas ureae]|uniref:CAAX protease self-immunity n=2 Tax=Nitrosomonas ureae TaxID=44577 RepID=A0A0S3AJI0_9PROT|nr:abortive infection protein [Nitrosomonas ureae]PXX15518.1 CAAX prenyl protease-like protein [Nitrosomonas ureae]SDU04976.1 CAAX protease self-immunity [Nitrosomonas ureae]
MKIIFWYLQEYVKTVDKWLLFFCSVWISLLMVLNYQWDIERVMIVGMSSRYYQFIALFTVYCCAFVVPYLFAIQFRKHVITPAPAFWLLLLFAPALFALKVSIANPLENMLQGVWGDYLTVVTTLPFKFLVVLIPLAVLYQILPTQPSFWGATVKDIRWKPYCIMLMLMIPLVIFASMQPDFLNAYPRLKQIAFIVPHTDNLPVYQLLYEISYGIDFVTIELFFRGFLLFAFVRYAGAAAILPMATFYCSIHFGKPLLECISSFLGGWILGVIAYRTQSIVGGLAVHLGIAWMMEIGGYMGNLWLGRNIA